jgi:hypothetical protein
MNARKMVVILEYIQKMIEIAKNVFFTVTKEIGIKKTKKAVETEVSQKKR